MHGERRRWRPTPRESTLSLSELIDASARTTTTGGPSSDRRQQKQKQRAPKEAKKKKEPKNQRHSGKNAPTATGDGVGRGASQCEFKVVVENMVALEDLEDPDERADVEKKLHAVLSRHGKLQSIEIDDATGAIVAAYADLEGARVTVSVLHGSEYESRSVSARLQSAGSSALAVGGGEESRAAATQVQAPAAEHDVPRKKSKRRSKLKSDVIRDRARRKQHQQNQQDGEKFVAFSLRSSTLVIRNLLDPEELEDDDEYADVYREAHGDLSEHGQLERLTIARRGPGKAANADVGSIVVNYEQAHTATKAFEFYNDKVFGGRRVTCEWVGRSVAVKVDGMLDPEELEDPDEYEDIKTEVSEYFAGYDQVSSVEIVRESGDCIVKCEHEAAASEFIRSVNGKKYGGHPLKVYLVQGQQFVDDVHKKSLIPTSRSTESTVEAPATQDAPSDASTASTVVTELAITLLQRLATLQERAHVQNPLQDKRSRRLVLGLHEVRRGILQRKIKLLVVGTDLEDAKPIGDAVHELVAAALEQEIPVIWPMNRRKLGRVLKKSVRVSCVGVYSVDGANEIFKHLLSSI